MINNVDLNTITLAELFNGFTNVIFSAVENAVAAKLSFLGQNTDIEKPISQEEACEHLGISEPVLLKLLELGLPRHGAKGVRAFWYFKSEINTWIRSNSKRVQMVLK